MDCPDSSSLGGEGVDATGVRCRIGAELVGLTISGVSPALVWRRWPHLALFAYRRRLHTLPILLLPLHQESNGPRQVWEDSLERKAMRGPGRLGNDHTSHTLSESDKCHSPVHQGLFAAS